MVVVVVVVVTAVIMVVAVVARCMVVILVKIVSISCLRLIVQGSTHVVMNTIMSAIIAKIILN